MNLNSEVVSSTTDYCTQHISHSRYDSTAEFRLKNGDEIPEPYEFPDEPEEYPIEPEPYEPDDPGSPEPEPSQPSEPNWE